MDPMTMLLISGLTQAGIGAYRNIMAHRGLDELNAQRMPKYMDAAGPLQQNLAMAQRQYNMGMSPEAKNLALNTMNTQRAQLFRNASEMSGGQMSNAFSRMGALNNAQGALQLGAQDQAARERAMGQMMGVNQQLSGLQQRDVAADQQRRMEATRGYGQAIQDSRNSMLGALTGYATGSLSQANAEANRQLYRDIYGLNQNNDGGIGPAPLGTTTTDNASYAPGYLNTNNSQSTMLDTPFRAPKSTPTFGPPQGTSYLNNTYYAPNALVYPTIGGFKQPANYQNAFGVPDLNSYFKFATPASNSMYGRGLYNQDYIDSKG